MNKIPVDEIFFSYFTLVLFLKCWGGVIGSFIQVRRLIKCHMAAWLHLTQSVTLLLIPVPAHLVTLLSGNYHCVLPKVLAVAKKGDVHIV